MNSNKGIVDNLKSSIEYRSKHIEYIELFKEAIKKYFLSKYDWHVRVPTGVSWFAVEEDTGYYVRLMRGGLDYSNVNPFEFTSKRLFEFCEEFECEFEKTTCSGTRYIFTFNDVDMSNAFVNG